MPGKCPPFPAEVELPHGCVFLAPRPVALCSPALLARTGGLFPLQRKPAEVTAGPSAVPPSPQDGRHGGAARPRGTPHLSCERGAAAFPRTPLAVGAVLARRRNAPQGCPGCVRTPSALMYPRVCGTAHTHPRVVTGRCDTPPEWGRAYGAGMRHACAGTHGRHTHGSRTHPCPETDTDSRFASVICKRTPAGRTPAAPQPRQPWGSPTPGTHSSAPSLPKFVGFVTPFPHCTQPTQLRAAAGARLQEAAAEGPPTCFLPCTR